MSYIKIPDKWGRTACLGVGKVLNDYNHAPYGETTNEYGSKLKFRTVGASRKITDKNGQERWSHQYLWCSVSAESPLAPLIRTLNEGDRVFLYGILTSSSYTHPQSGIEHNKSFCGLEYLQIISRADGSKPETANIDFIEPDNDEFDF